MRYALLLLVVLGCGSSVGPEKLAECRENARANVERDGCEFRASACTANPELGIDGVECWVQMSCGEVIRETKQLCFTIVEDEG